MLASRRVSLPRFRTPRRYRADSCGPAAFDGSGALLAAGTPGGAKAGLRLPRLAGRSHGADTVSPSSWAASVVPGFQRRGGATTTERLKFGASAAIMAVSARNRCDVAVVPAAADPADPAPSTVPRA